MPLDAVDGLVAGLELVVHLAGLPIPEADVALGVAAGEELAIGAAGDVDGCSGVVVAAVALLPVLAELVGRAVDDDLVVGALVGDVLARRV